MFKKIRQFGKLTVGFQKSMQAIQLKNPQIVILAKDSNEAAFKKAVLSQCEAKNVCVSQKVVKQLMAEVLGVKEKEGQICCVVDWGERWTELDRRTFDKWFL